jgi:hypothetical protein
VPFCVLNTILLDRTVRSRNDETLLPAQRLCSDEYDTSFLMLLSVLLTSVGMLVYKAMHLLPLPRVWAEHKRLAAEAAEFEECQAAIDRRMGALASEDAGPSGPVRLHGSPAELEPQRIGDSESMGGAEIVTGRGGAALLLAMSCEHAAAADPAPEVADKHRAIVRRSDPHARGIACPAHARVSTNSTHCCTHNVHLTGVLQRRCARDSVRHGQRR